MILNTSAGSASDEAAITTAVHTHLPGAELLFPKASGEASSLAARAVEAGCDLLIAAGGDGTLNEVLNGLGGRFGTTRLGLLPLGTGNDFARSIGMPTELEPALRILAEGRSTAVDVVRVTTSEVRYMINVSAGGFSAQVNDKMTDEVKERWGPFCYARSLVAALPELTDFHTEIVLDDTERIDSPAYNIIVANGRYVASGVHIAPCARFDDGLADLIVLPVASLGQLAFLASATLRGTHLENDQLIYRRARKIHISSEPSMRFNTDGEPLAAGTATFEVLHRALEFVIGEPEPGSSSGT